MKNSCAVVTGASGGIGRELTRGLALRGIRVVMACRNAKKAEEVRRELGLSPEQAEVRTLDLASFASIERFCEGLERDGLQAGLLLNNAGAMSPQYARTADGFEMNVGVNYMGTWLLTRLLLPRMPPSGRIVNTVSCTARVGHVGTGFLAESCAGGWPEGKAYRRLETYSNSKLALSVFSAELYRRLAGTSLRVAAADPGVVNTDMITMQRWFDPLADLFFRPFIKSAARGAVSALRAAAETYSGEGCPLYTERKVKPLPPYPGAAAFWEKTEAIVREKFPGLPGLPQ